MEIGGVSPEEVAVPELGVAPLINTDTELEDELPAPEDSPLFRDSSPEKARPPGVRPATRELVDLELEKALLCVSIPPEMVTPLEEPVEGFPTAPSSYPETPVLVLSYVDPDASSRSSPLRVAADGPEMGVFQSFLSSPACSVYEPATSPVTPYLQEDAAYQPPPSPATMVQYLSRDDDLLLGDVMALPVLSSPLSPLSVVVDVAPESSVGSPAGVPAAPSSDGMLDLSREGPFDVLQDALESGATPQVLNSLPGCQYHMTSYDDSVDRSDFNPAYGFHLHEPRLLEYAGAPESARLLSRTPEYTPHGSRSGYVGRLQLQHDVRLILSNLQVLGQYMTSLNRMSSEMMRVAFDHEPFPTEAVQSVAPTHRVRRVAHYVAAMGLWRPPSTPGVLGPIPSSSCNACMMCCDCFPDLPK